MKYKKYKKKNKHFTPADIVKLDDPKKAKFSPVETSELNIPYYFKDTEWEF